MKKSLFAPLTLATVFATHTAQSAELAMKPGLWESTTTRTSSMGAGASTDTSRECLKENTFNPQQIMKDMQDCKLVEDKLLNIHTLKYKMVCSMAGAQASMEGEYYTKGDIGNGKMKINVNMGGMNMNMDLTWDAKRVGDC